MCNVYRNVKNNLTLNLYKRKGYLSRAFRVIRVIASVGNAE